MSLDHSPLHHLLGYCLARASIQTDQIFYSALGGPLELRPVEFTILALIDANSDVTAKRLSTALALSPPNMSVVLDRLVKRGLIRRAQSGTDKRAQLLHLTAKGAALNARANKVSQDMERDLLARITPAERAMLFELLDKVVADRRKAATPAVSSEAPVKAGVESRRQKPRAQG